MNNLPNSFYIDLFTLLVKYQPKADHEKLAKQFVSMVNAIAHSDASSSEA